MTLFALIDGNSFYASCQIAFNPALATRPVVVLSNNDGCIVAANDHAKALDRRLAQQHGPGGYRAAQPGSMMFQPYFKVAKWLERHNTAVFSSNYELYADMSQRMHRIIGQFSPHQEIYSIDESFLELTGLPIDDPSDYARQIRQRVKQWLGLPVAVGLAPTKTLAKLANHLAKKRPEMQGVLDWNQLSEDIRAVLLKQTDVGQIWGIGRRLSEQLKSSGIASAFDLQQACPKSVRKRFSVHIERIVKELNGQSCLQLHQHPDAKQQIVSSRSFGQPVTQFDLMKQAVASYAATAAQKLRRQHSVCHKVSVFITTSHFQSNQPQYRNLGEIPLIYPSDSSVLISKVAILALKRIWREGFAYSKASVTLSGLDAKGALQTDLFAPDPRYSGNPKSDRLMDVMDQLNLHMGKGTLVLANSGLHHQGRWKMKRDNLSPRCTTRWEELLTVR